MKYLKIHYVHYDLYKKGEDVRGVAPPLVCCYIVNKRNSYELETVSVSVSSYISAFSINNNKNNNEYILAIY